MVCFLSVLWACVVCGSLLLCDVIVMVNVFFFFFLMRRRPPRATQSRSSAASDVYKRQTVSCSISVSLRMGSPKAAVLPVPVCAKPIKS